MRKAKFQIENSSVYEGYTDGKLWNGWACPWFTKEVADQIKEEVSPDTVMLYVEEFDAFIYLEEGDEEPSVFKGINGLYPIGNGSWIWDEV